MKQVSVINVRMGDETIPVTLYKIEENETLPEVSRVYVFASNEKNELALIYNSKRDIWGFPGGHADENETVVQTATRECIEEIQYSLDACEPHYVLSNKVDDTTESLQVICFAKTGKPSTEFVDDAESVSEVKFSPINNVLEEVGNKELWEEILKNYEAWLTNN